MVRGAAVKGRPNKIMRLLAEKYPTKEAVYEQLIYLQSRLSLPKGIEHFMSDLHGEYAILRRGNAACKDQWCIG